MRAVHRGCLQRPRCPLTPGAAASWGGLRGRRLFGLPPSALGPEGEGGGCGGGPLVPWRRPLTAEGGRPGGPGPGGQPSAGGLHSSPAPLYLEPDPRGGSRWGPLSPPPSPRGAGLPGAAVRLSGQRCRLRGSRFPPFCLPLPSRRRWRALLRHAVSWGGRGLGSPAPPPTLSRPPSGPSPAPPLVWGLGLLRWRVAPAVEPVGKGAAQGPREPVVGVNVRDAEHRPPFQEGRPRRPPVGPRRPDHSPEDPLVVLWGCPPSQGVPPGFLRPSGGARHRKAGSSSPWWSPGWPSSTTRTPPPPGGGPHPPEGPGPCPSPGPRAGPPLPLAPAPPAAPVPAAPVLRPAPPRRGHPRRLRSRCRRGLAGAGVVGVWGDDLSGVWVDVVQVVVVVVVVVGVVRRHLLDAGGDAPHRLHVRLRGRPAPRPPPFRPAVPPGLPCPVPPVPGG